MTEIITPEQLAEKFEDVEIVRFDPSERGFFLDVFPEVDLDLGEVVLAFDTPLVGFTLNALEVAGLCGVLEQAMRVLSLGNLALGLEVSGKANLDLPTYRTITPDEAEALA